MATKSNKAPNKKRGFFTSFRYAGNGLRAVFYRGKNIRIFTIIIVLVLLAGYLLNVTTVEWLILIMIMSITFVAEVFNTSIEVLCDKVSPKKDPHIAIAKDIAAAAVLTLAIASAVIGTTIFLPRLITLFS